MQYKCEYVIRIVQPHSHYLLLICTWNGAQIASVCVRKYNVNFWMYLMHFVWKHCPHYHNHHMFYCRFSREWGLAGMFLIVSLQFPPFIMRKLITRNFYWIRKASFFLTVHALNNWPFSQEAMWMQFNVMRRTGNIVLL